MCAHPWSQGVCAAAPSLGCPRSLHWDQAATDGLREVSGRAVEVEDEGHPGVGPASAFLPLLTGKVRPGSLSVAYMSEDRAKIWVKKGFQCVSTASNPTVGEPMRFQTNIWTAITPPHRRLQTYDHIAPLGAGCYLRQTLKEGDQGREEALMSVHAKHSESQQGQGALVASTEETTR